MAERAHSSDLELNQDLDFERRSWIIERIGWVIMAVAGVAALAGLLGTGPISDTTAGELGGPLWLEYSRFGRFRAPLTLRIHLGPNANQHGTVRVWLSRDYLEGVQIEQVSPQPDRVEAGPERLTYVFPVSELSRATALTFSLKTAKIGRQRGCVGLATAVPVCFSQLIYP
ncbi:MAG TPA: hypothetical protein VLK82_09330 [Candidatus Tectomicrobia bacterium]|nr:hypothetical protein [Candidatus Tectomicrobia bacterium]